MTVSVKWHSNFEQVLLFRFVYPWSWIEFTWAVEESGQIITPLAPRLIPAIVDLSDSLRLPSGNGIKHLTSIFQSRPTNAGIAVVVTQDKTIRQLTHLLGQVIPIAKQRVRVADNMDEAIAVMASLLSSSQQ
ncbi:MAG: hypothetical protein ACOYLB_01310 [Phototrophicaceae bacterium]